MEGVDGGNVGEDVSDHLRWEGASTGFFRQPSAKHLEGESGLSRGRRATAEDVRGVTALT